VVSPDGVVPSQMVGVSSSVNLPLHHKLLNFSSGTGSPGWSWKKDHKTVVVVWLKQSEWQCGCGNGSVAMVDSRASYTVPWLWCYNDSNEIQCVVSTTRC